MNKKEHYLYRKGFKVEYSSNDYLVVNKSYDLHVNSDNPDVQVTLQKQLEQSFPDLINDSLVHKFHFCHRLDYATSGLICIAKTKRAAASVSRVLQSRLAVKIYIAILRNVITEEFLDIKGSIGEPSDPVLAKLRVLVNGGERQRSAHTRVLLLQTGTYGGAPACKVLLLALTGRRHQLRAHVCDIGNIIVGDYTYSNRMDCSPHRMMLHAYHISFPLPGETVSVTSEDPFTEAALNGQWRPLVTFNKLDEKAMQKIIDGR